MSGRSSLLFLFVRSSVPFRVPVSTARVLPSPPPLRRCSLHRRVARACHSPCRGARALRSPAVKLCQRHRVHVVCVCCACGGRACDCVDAYAASVARKSYYARALHCANPFVRLYVRSNCLARPLSFAFPASFPSYSTLTPASSLSFVLTHHRLSRRVLSPPSPP